MRFRLRTLMIVLALGPPVLALPWLAWQSYREYRIKRAIDEFNRIEVRPQPTIYVPMGLKAHPKADAAAMEMRRKQLEELWLKAMNEPENSSVTTGN